jgi:hypothetical protein
MPTQIAMDNGPAMAEIVNERGEIDQFVQVRVVNNDRTPLRWQYANRWFEIPGVDDPDGKRNFEIMPYLAMVYYCGDPRAFDVSDRFRNRTDEWSRLRTVYGIYDKYPAMAHMLPNVSVYTTNDKPIWTVLDDHEGTKVNNAVETTNNQLEQYQALVAEQAKTLAKYQGLIDDLVNKEGGPGNRQALTAEQLADIQVSTKPDLIPESESSEGLINDDGSVGTGEAVISGVTEAELEAALMEQDDQFDPNAIETDVASDDGPIFG